MDYQTFLASKRETAPPSGIEVDPATLNSNLFDWQRMVVAWALRRGRAALFEDCGLGKGQPATSGVLTPDGWRTIGSLKVGDEVFASDGRPHKVTGVYPKMPIETYRVSFSDGTSYVVDREHLHVVRTQNDRNRGKPWRVMSTEQLLTCGNLKYGQGDRSNNYDIPTCDPIEFPDNHLPIHPYLLGVLLGDGCLRHRVSFTTLDRDILECVEDCLPPGMHLSGTCDPITFNISGKLCRPNPLKASLVELGLWGKLSHEKHVPSQYLLGTVWQRTELLRGLMDTDGYAGESVQFSSASKWLADGVTFLVQSLGGIARRTVKETSYEDRWGFRVQCRQSHIVTVTLPDICPFKLKRKADLWNPSPRAFGRFITAIDFDCIQPTVCISVDSPDHTYVTEHCIVTHNTLQQLAWAGELWRTLSVDEILLLCPIAVAEQTLAEHQKFRVGCPARIVANQSQVGSGINITNYEKLHKFEADKFDAVILDESSILKSFTGAVKRQLCETFARTPYKLACTATPAPNDHMELGNHAQFLGIMESPEMLSRWFINDTMKAGGYRLKEHGRADFWRWVASWAVSISKPSDIGYDDTGYVLPELKIVEHVVDSGCTPGMLFGGSRNVNATNAHEEKRASIESKAQQIADIVNSHFNPVVVWVDTNYEADAIRPMIPGCVEVRGSDRDDVKADTLSGFVSGKFRVLITKSEIAGFGSNWQHCNETHCMANFSFERWYQLIRRFWRFGQTQPVTCHLWSSEAEQNVVATLKRKQSDYSEMVGEMCRAMVDGMHEELHGRLPLRRYQPESRLAVPGWLAGSRART